MAKTTSEHRAGWFDKYKQSMYTELKAIKKERHVIIYNACELWLSISRYENLLNDLGFNFSLLERFYGAPFDTRVKTCSVNTKKIVLEDKDRERLLIRNIKSFIYIVGEKLPKLNKRYYEVELLCNIQYNEYVNIRETINRFFVECVLNGDCMNGSGYIGRHIVRHFKYPEGRKRLNLGMTFKYIKELKSKGETLYSAKNPNGKQYRIYFNDDGFYFWQWLRNGKMPNVKMYSFRLYDSNSDDSKKNMLANMTSEEIILSRNISNYKKLLELVKIPTYNKRYDWNGTLFDNRESKSYGINGSLTQRLNKYDDRYITNLAEYYGI